MSQPHALSEALRATGVPLPPAVLSAFEAHYDLLVTWNRTHNLTRITAPEAAATRHYLDCWMPLVSCLKVPGAFIDVGSGAGFPGLMAALAWPNAEATLIEPAQKRVSFLLQAAQAMGVKVKVEAPGTAVTAPCVLSRATFSPGSRDELQKYLSPQGTIAVWGHPHDETMWRTEVGTWPGIEDRLLPYSVPGLEERALLVATR